MVRWAIAAWTDAFAAIEQMPQVFGAAFVAIVVLFGLEIILVPRAFTADFGPQVLRVVVGILQAFLLTPVAIAVHRFVILQERTSAYRLNPTDSRVGRFFFFAVLVQLLIFIPSFGLKLADMTFGSSLRSSGTLVTVLLVVWAMMTLRTLILFPAIAVDAPGAGLNNALLDTKGHILRMLLVVMITAVPILVVSLLEIFVLGRPTWPGFIGGVILILLRGIEIMVPMAVYAALASRMFLALGSRLAGPAAGPEQA